MHFRGLQPADGVLARRGLSGRRYAGAAFIEFALADKSISQPLASLGLIAAPSSPQEFSALIRRDYEKWKRTFAGRKAPVQ